MTRPVFNKMAFLISMLVVIVHSGCKKDNQPPGGTNQALVAIAGDNQTIFLPNDSVYLDASASNPNGIIVTYKWTKIAGPGSITIVDPNALRTWITDLQEGDYYIELKVADSLGRYTKDTVIIFVTSAPASTRWTKLEYLTADESFGDWFNNENFLLGINNDVYAISGKGKIWQYNEAINTWSFVGSFPENMWQAPVTFCINGMGYRIGNGHCWQYNPATNQWTRKNDPPVTRFSAPLVIGNKAYLRSSDSNRLFAYEPVTDVYIQKKDPPALGTNWYLTVSVVINDQGYYIGANGECWKYDASIDHWQQRANVTGLDKDYQTSLVSFSVNNKGYILKDNNEASEYNTPLHLWRYDPNLNQWTRIDDGYHGEGIHKVKAVSLGSVAYIGLGYNGGGDFWVRDLWRYK